MVKVSILIPTYNLAQFLDDAIQSALMQTYADLEIVIVDDASSDNTEEVVQKYLYDSRIRFYKNQVNLGLVGNFNKCIFLAKGIYIKFLLADDLFHPRLLETFVPIMDQYPNVAIVTSPREEFGLRSSKSDVPCTHLQKGKRVICESLASRNWLGEPTVVMFRKSDVEKVGNFDSRFYLLTDWDMWLRLLTVGDCYIYPESLSYFRIHENQQSTIIRKELTNYLEYYQFYKDIKVYKKYQINSNELDIDFFVSLKAATCFKAIIKLVPKLYKRQSRVYIQKALKILRDENVPIGLIYKTLTNKLPSGSEQLYIIKRKLAKYQH